MEIARHWRNSRRNLRFEGFKKITPEGGETFSLNGFSWSEPAPNGHHKEENPLESAVVYQAQTSPGKNGRNGNGRIPVKISGEVNISAEVNA